MDALNRCNLSQHFGSLWDIFIDIDIEINNDIKSSHR